MDKQILNKLHKTELKIMNEIDRVCEKNNLQYFLIGGTLLGAIRHKGFIPWDDDMDIAMPRDDYEKFLEIAKIELKDNFFIDSSKNNKKYLNVFAKVRLKNTLYEEQLCKNYDTNKELWIDIFPLDDTNIEPNSNNTKIGDKILKFKKISKFKLILDEESEIKKIIKKTISLIISPRMSIKIAESYMKKENNKGYKYFVNYGSQYGVKKQTHLKEKYFPSIKVEFEGNLYNAPRDYNYVLSKIYGENYMQLPPKEKQITHNPLKIVFEDGQIIEFDKEN